MSLEISHTKFDDIVRESLTSKICGIYKISIGEPVYEDLVYKMPRHMVDNPKWVVHVEIEYFEGATYTGYWKFEADTLELVLIQARETLLRSEERMRIWSRLEVEMKKLYTAEMTIDGARTYKANWFHEHYEKECQERGL